MGDETRRPTLEPENLARIKETWEKGEIDIVRTGTLMSLRAQLAEAHRRIAKLEAMRLPATVTVDFAVAGAFGRRDEASRWFVRAGYQVLFYPAGIDAHDSLRLCEQWLSENGYERDGGMPPESFEYTRR